MFKRVIMLVFFFFFFEVQSRMQVNTVAILNDNC